MAVRVLLVAAAFGVLYGCGQASSPVEKQEKQGGVEQAAEEGQPEAGSSPEPTTERAVGNIPIAGIVGENVDAGSYDLRVLDHFTTDDYYYNGGLYEEEDALSQAGKFVVVNYTVTNTSPESVGPNLLATLHVTAPDGNVEVYDQTDAVAAPHRTGATLYLDDIPPRGMLTSQFIFDVPTDVEPQLLAVREEPTIDQSFEVGVVDLRSADPQGPRPEEVVALAYEYVNMQDWERAYALFAQETKDRVSEETYVSSNRREEERGNGYVFTDYSFPTVDIEGDRATIQVVRSYSYEEDGEEGQERVTQEVVLEDEGWRIVMRDDQYEFYEGE